MPYLNLLIGNCTRQSTSLLEPETAASRSHLRYTVACADFPQPLAY